MNGNFGEEHRREVPKSKLEMGGYPDSGSGRYTIQAGYEFWYNFNVAQR